MKLQGAEFENSTVPDANVLTGSPSNMLQNATVRGQFLEDEEISWVRNYYNETSFYTDMCYKDVLFVTISCVNNTAECIQQKEESNAREKSLLSDGK
jgi:hypothetical protein